MAESKQEALITAINNGDLMEVRRLVDLGADVEVGGGEFNLPPIMYACWQGNLDIVRILSEHGADIDYNGMNEGGPLTFAAATGNVQLVNLLLELGAAVDTMSLEGNETALHKAVFRNRHETVRPLIKHGADVNIPTRSGGHTAMFEGGAKLRGERPLHLAAAYADVEMVRILLDAGADKSLGDDRGDLPIAWAGRHQRNGDILELL